MNKVKKIRDFLKQHLSLIAVVFALCFCIGTYVYSAYTDTNFVPKTITVHDNPGYLFTSDYLEETSGGVVLKTHLVTVLSADKKFEDMENQPFYITLRNYNTNDRTIYLDINGGLKYTIKAEITDNKGNPLSAEDKAALKSSVDIYKFNDVDLVNGEDSEQGAYLDNGYSFDDLLPQGGRQEKSYKVEIDKNHLKEPKYFIKVTATPTIDPPSPRAREISAILGLSWEYIKSQSNWSGRFTDTAADSKDMDGFNYMITGSGTGTGKLIWDPSYLELDKYTRDEYSSLTINDESDDRKSIQLVLDDRECASYKFRFHRKSDKIDEFEKWSDKKESLLIGSNQTIALEFIYSEPSTETST